MESSSGFCVRAFGRNPVSVAVKMFSHLICCVNKYYKNCTSNAICKDNDAINCIIFQNKDGSFRSTFTGHTLC
jgi:hypothetical protein